MTMQEHVKRVREALELAHICFEGDRHDLGIKEKYDEALASLDAIERALTQPDDLQNSLAIVKAIIAATNAGKKVVFDEDMGAGSITIFVGDNHTHCGYPEAKESVLIKNMADTLTGKGGLSWA